MATECHIGLCGSLILTSPTSPPTSFNYMLLRLDTNRWPRWKCERIAAHLVPAGGRKIQLTGNSVGFARRELPLPHVLEGR